MFFFLNCFCTVFDGYYILVIKESKTPETFLIFELFTGFMLENKTYFFSGSI